MPLKKKKEKKEKKVVKAKKGKKGEKVPAVSSSRPASAYATPQSGDPDDQNPLFVPEPGTRTAPQYSVSGKAAKQDQDRAEMTGPDSLAYEDIPGTLLQPDFRNTEDGAIYECPDEIPYEAPPDQYSSSNGPAIPKRHFRISTMSDVSMSSTTTSVINDRMSQMSLTSNFQDGDLDDDLYRNIPCDETYQKPEDNSTTMSLQRSVSTTNGSYVPPPLPRTRTNELSNKMATVKFYQRLSQPKFCIDATKYLPSAFEYPWAIAVSPINGDIYITDIEGCQVIRFHKTGRLLDRMGSRGTGDGEFMKPRGIALTGDGMVIVSDQYNSRIQIFDGNGRFIRKFGREGSGNGQFYRPAGLALSRDNRLYIADQWNHRIQVWTLSGEPIMTFGSKGSGDGQYQQPNDIAILQSGDVIVVDTNNNRLQLVTSDGRHISTIGCCGTENGQLSGPKSVAVDNDGFCIVADDHNNRLQIFDPNGKFVHCFGKRGDEDGEFDQLAGVAISRSTRDILVSDYYNRRIQIF